MWLPSFWPHRIRRHQILQIGIYRSSKNGRKPASDGLVSNFSGVLPAPPSGGHSCFIMKESPLTATIIDVMCDHSLTGNLTELIYIIAVKLDRILLLVYYTSFAEIKANREILYWQQWDNASQRLIYQHIAVQWCCLKSFLLFLNKVGPRGNVQHAKCFKKWTSP